MLSSLAERLGVDALAAVLRKPVGTTRAAARAMVARVRFMVSPMSFVGCDAARSFRDYRQSRERGHDVHPSCRSESDRAGRRFRLARHRKLGSGAHEVRESRCVRP